MLRQSWSSLLASGVSGVSTLFQAGYKIFWKLGTGLTFTTITLLNERIAKGPVGLCVITNNDVDGIHAIKPESGMPIRCRERVISSVVFLEYQVVDSVEVAAKQQLPLLPLPMPHRQDARS